MHYIKKILMYRIHCIQYRRQRLCTMYDQILESNFRRQKESYLRRIFNREQQVRVEVSKEGQDSMRREQPGI